MSSQAKEPSPLLAKLRAAREIWLDGHEGRRYLYRNPTVVGFMAIKDTETAEYLRATLIGWDGFTEAMLIPSGAATPAAFDVDLCIEWLEDHPDELMAVGNAAVAATSGRLAELGALEKK